MQNTYHSYFQKLTLLEQLRAAAPVFSNTDMFIYYYPLKPVLTVFWATCLFTLRGSLDMVFCKINVELYVIAGPLKNNGFDDAPRTLSPKKLKVLQKCRF